MGRRMRWTGPPRNRGPRRNREIRLREVLVIGPAGQRLGVMSPAEGMEHARQYGLDLVEVAPQARPAVCKIVEYGKYRYDQQQKERRASRKESETSTVRFRPKTDPHDLATKVRQARRLLDKGNRVQLMVRMRGRERAYPDRWTKTLREVIDRLEGVRVAAPPRAEGRTITAVVEPA